jgi:hypothetical protein
VQPLTLDDLVPLDEYAARRSEFFESQARYLDRYRRVRIGPRVTLVFENRQTLLFRIHELLRIARLSDPLRVQQELDWYNRLLPSRDRLQAALLLETPGTDPTPETLAFWRELSGEHVRLHLGSVALTGRLVTCRPEDRWIGSAHWLEVTVPPAIRHRLTDPGKPAYFEVVYNGYEHESHPLNEAVRRSLFDDLELSDRDRAA